MLAPSHKRNVGSAAAVLQMTQLSTEITPNAPNANDSDVVDVHTDFGAMGVSVQMSNSLRLAALGSVKNDPCDKVG